MLVIAATHPVQYHAPVFRAVAHKYGVPVHIVYGSDFSVSGYFDAEFQQHFAWDTPLVTPQDACTFLETVENGGARSYEQVTARRFGTELDRLRPAAVLLMGYGTRFHFGVFAAAWRRSIPIIFRAETSDHATARNTAKSALRDALLRMLYGRCDYLLPIGIRSRAHYIRLGCPESKLIASPYCVDTAYMRAGEDFRSGLRAHAREKMGIGENDVAILFSGKLAVRKGPHVLVDAAAALPTALGERAVLVFLGQGEEALNLKAQAESRNVRARFAGFQNQSRLSEFYHAADVLCLPSLYSETWGLVVNEALHHGVACVVSSSVGSAADLVECGVTGEIAQTGSAGSLADAIARAASYAGTPQTRQACREKVSHYTVDHAAQGIAEAYDHIAGSRFALSA